MNPQLLFWVPAALRLLLIVSAGGIAWFFWGPLVGLAIGLIGMAALVLLQLHYLYQLAAWLDDPDSAKLPDGWGAWTEIFSRLYRLRRGDAYSLMRDNAESSSSGLVGFVTKANAPRANPWWRSSSSVSICISSTMAIAAMWWWRYGANTA